MAAPDGNKPMQDLLNAIVSNPALLAALNAVNRPAPPGLTPTVTQYQPGALLQGIRLGSGLPEGHQQDSQGPNATIAAVQPADPPMANLRGPSTLRINGESGEIPVRNGKPSKEKSQKAKRKSIGNKDTTAASADSTVKASDSLKLIQVFLIPDARIVENEIDLSEPRFEILLGLIEKEQCVAYPILLKSDSAKDIVRKVNAELPSWRQNNSFNWAHLALGPDKVLRDKGDSESNFGLRLHQVYFKHHQAFIYCPYSKDTLFMKEFARLVEDATGDDIFEKGSDTKDDKDSDEDRGLENKMLESADEMAPCNFCNEPVWERVLEEHESICQMTMKSKARGSKSSDKPPITPTKANGQGTFDSPLVLQESPEVKKSSPYKRRGPPKPPIVADPVKYARQGPRETHTRTSRKAAASADSAVRADAAESRAKEARESLIREKVLSSASSMSSPAESSSRSSLLSPTSSLASNFAKTKMVTRSSSRSASVQPH